MSASKSSSTFHLIYWPGVPGRGEFVRLALAEAGVTYTDTAFQPDGVKEVVALASPDNVGDSFGNPPAFASPALRHGDVVVSQTANILLYLSEVFGDALAPPKAGEETVAKFHVNALAMTALNAFGDEVLASHNPISPFMGYEAQKEEAARLTKLYVLERLPKFLGYFERVISSPASGDGPWLYGGKLSYADLVLFQGIEGLKYQFPKAMAKAEASGKYAKVFALHEAVKERPNIKAYLASERRQKFSKGIFQYYPELDIEE